MENLRYYYLKLYHFLCGKYRAKCGEKMWRKIGFRTTKMWIFIFQQSLCGNPQKNITAFEKHLLRLFAVFPQVFYNFSKHLEYFVKSTKNTKHQKVKQGRALAMVIFENENKKCQANSQFRGVLPFAFYKIKNNNVKRYGKITEVGRCSLFGFTGWRYAFCKN